MNTFTNLFKLTLAAALFSAVSAFGQTPTPSPTATVSGIIGEVKSIDAPTNQMIIRADDGVIHTVHLSEKTQYKRLAPGEKSLANAANISLVDIGPGDRVLAQWRAGADIKTAPTPRVVIMSKGDIAKRQEQERAEWRRRGISGIVSAVNPTAKEITVTSRSLMGTQQAVIIPVTDKVMMRRYPPDTIPKYSEAKPSSFEEVKVGDQLRALGDKSTDGTHLTAEEVVFGTFKIAGGTVTSIDAANNQIKINDLQTKKPLTIVVKSDSVIRRFPENLGMMLGGGMGPGGAGAAGGQRPAGQGPGGQATAQPRPQGQGPGGPGAGPGGGPGRGGMNMADMLERLPVITINDLKVGEMVLMSSLPGSDPSQLTAISLVSGVEPLLTIMAARQQSGGQPRPQNVDLNGSFGGMFGGIGVP